MAKNREVLDAYIAALTANDVAALRDLLHPEMVQEIPQSGERFRGRDNVIATFEHYPGAEEMRVQTEYAQVFGGEYRWLLSPMFSVLTVEGSGDRYTWIGKVRYPDGSLWHVAEVVTIRDGKIAHGTSVYGQDFEPPAWRAQWTERM